MIKVKRRMNRSLRTILFAGLAFLCSGPALHPAEEPLLIVQLNRAGPLLSDFHQSLYDEFVRSPANDYFVKSKLFLKFTQTSGVYQGLSSTAFSIENLEKMGFNRAILYLYNVRELLFFAALEIGERDFQLTSLFLNRAKFKTYPYSGITYFLKTDDGGGKYFCFWYDRGVLYLSNSPRIMESHLDRIRKAEPAFVSDAEKDFAVFMRFYSGILGSPYLSSYWFNRDVLRLKRDYQRAEVYLHLTRGKIVENRYFELDKNPEKVQALGTETIPAGDLILMTSNEAEIGILARTFLKSFPIADLPKPDKFFVVKRLQMDERLLVDNRHWLKLSFADSSSARKWLSKLEAHFAPTAAYLDHLLVFQKDADIVVKSDVDLMYHPKPLGGNVISYGYLRLDKAVGNATGEIAALGVAPELDPDQKALLDRFVKPVLGILRKIASVEKITTVSGRLLAETVTYTLSAQ
jgi:hypothetical protein